MAKDVVRSDKRAALHEALVQAATRTIIERGHTALRARELAQETSCALGAIYNVFPDLDALIFAVKDRTLDALETELAQALITHAVSSAQLSDARATAEQELHILAETYRAFVFAQPNQWRTLFEHRTPDGAVPETYLAKLDRILGRIEQPLHVLVPEASEIERRLLGRALFSAVHGMVMLGLEEKLIALPPHLLKWQLRMVVHAAATGLKIEANDRVAV